MVARDYAMVQNKEGAYEARKEVSLKDEKNGLISKLNNVVRGAVAGAMIYVGAMAPRSADADLIKIIDNTGGQQGVGGSTMYISNQEGGSLNFDSGDMYWYLLERPPGSADNWLRVYSDQINILRDRTDREMQSDSRPFSGTDANKSFPLRLDTQGSDAITSSGNYIQFQLQSAIDEGREFYSWNFTLTDPNATFAEGSGNTRSGVWNLNNSSSLTLPAYNLNGVQGLYGQLDVSPGLIPEPSTGALVLTGLAAAAVSRRRRNYSRKQNKR